MPNLLTRLLTLLLALTLLWAPVALAENGNDENAGNNGSYAPSGAPSNPDNFEPDPRDSDDFASVELEEMEATYRARMRRGVSLRGEAVRSLKRRDDGQWDYRFDVTSFIADVKESSVISYEDNWVRPHRYRYSLEGRMIRNRATRVDFNWFEDKLRDRENNRAHDISETPNLQDQLSAQLQLWVDLKSGKQRMEYIIADNGDTKDYQFEVLGREELETENFGTVEAVKVWRVRDDDSPRTTHMWFVPEWDYLLVRLEQREDGGEDFDIYLQKADFGGHRLRP